MKHHCILFATALMLSFPVLSNAQDGTRVVRGVVLSEDGDPLPAATITTAQGDKFAPNPDGTFEIRVSYLSRQLSISAPYYITREYDIDGSYLLVKLKEDKDAVKKELERISAEVNAKRQAELERIAAEERARKEAEEKARQEELARQKAEKERIAAEERARREAEEKAQQEERARQKAEKKRIASEKDEAYDQRFRNRGLEHSVTFAYVAQNSKCEPVYVYSGYRSFSSLHPILLDYTLSYKINRKLSVGVGVGILYNLKSISIKGDDFIYTDFKEKRIDIPVFASFKMRFARARVRPVLAVSGGFYPLSKTALVGGDVGIEFRLGKRPSIEAGAQLRSTPYPYFSEDASQYGYKMSFSPGAYLRFNL